MPTTTSASAPTAAPAACAETLRRLGWSNREVAVTAGVSLRTVARWRQSAAAPPPALAACLARPRPILAGPDAAHLTDVRPRLAVEAG